MASRLRDGTAGSAAAPAAVGEREGACDGPPEAVGTVPAGAGAGARRPHDHRTPSTDGGRVSSSLLTLRQGPTATLSAGYRFLAEPISTTIDRDPARSVASGANLSLRANPEGEASRQWQGGSCMLNHAKIITCSRRSTLTGIFLFVLVAASSRTAPVQAESSLEIQLSAPDTHCGGSQPSCVTPHMFIRAKKACDQLARERDLGEYQSYTSEPATGRDHRGGHSFVFRYERGNCHVIVQPDNSISHGPHYHP